MQLGMVEMESHYRTKQRNLRDANARMIVDNMGMPSDVDLSGSVAGQSEIKELRNAEGRCDRKFWFIERPGASSSTKCTKLLFRRTQGWKLGSFLVEMGRSR